MSDLESNLYGHELARLLEAQSIAKRTYEAARKSNVSRSVLSDVKVSDIPSFLSGRSLNLAEVSRGRPRDTYPESRTG